MTAEQILKPKNPTTTIDVNGIVKTVAEWGKCLGYTRTSSYRIFREGKMHNKIQHLLLQTQL